MNASNYEITTRRLQGGWVGRALAAEQPAAALAEGLAQHLDQDEGWVARYGDSWLWCPHRLALSLTAIEASTQATLLVESVVVEGAEPTAELMDWLSDLNVHASGWRWWLGDDFSVRCSMRVPVSPQKWWWALMAVNAVPRLATLADSMAELLAEVSRGRVCTFEHPDRGPRLDADGWLEGVRLGSREPSASLDVWLSEAEYTRLEAALDVMDPPVDAVVDRPLSVLIRDADAAPAVVVRKHWHGELGWGWLIATLAGGVADSSGQTDSQLRIFAAGLNLELSRGEAGSFAGWSYSREIGLFSAMFIPAYDVEELIAAAGPSVGDVLAMLCEAPARLMDKGIVTQLASDRLGITISPPTETALEAISGLAWRIGPIGFSYFAPPRTTTAIEKRVDVSPWLAPRQLLIASFGFFNPMGPTVSSLELGLVAEATDMVWTLYWVMRHPLLPEIFVLGSLRNPDEGELEDLIYRALTSEDPGPLGVGCEWLAVHAYADAVVGAAEKVAHRHEEVDWRGEADDLLYYAWNPWTRVSVQSSDVPTAFDSDMDPVQCWLSAVTDPQVCDGMRLFMRSAWEGSKAYRDTGYEDPNAAQQVTDRIVSVCTERLVEHTRALEAES